LRTGIWEGSTWEEGSANYGLMKRAVQSSFLSVEEYLAGEEQSEVRHEYLAGDTYAMAGGSAAHNTIALNVAAALRARLRGGPCRVFIADVKVRIVTAESGDIFYYPDVMVTCDPADNHTHFKTSPKLIVEVLSEGTERIERGEKFRTYIGLVSMEEYVLIAQEKREVTIFRRGTGWKAERSVEDGAKVELRSVGVSLEVGEVYDGVE
jgi:Uma2 family endonuclease